MASLLAGGPLSSAGALPRRQQLSGRPASALLASLSQRRSFARGAALLGREPRPACRCVQGLDNAGAGWRRRRGREDLRMSQFTPFASRNFAERPSSPILRRLDRCGLTCRASSLSGSDEAWPHPSVGVVVVCVWGGGAEGPRPRVALKRESPPELDPLTVRARCRGRIGPSVPPGASGLAAANAPGAVELSPAGALDRRLTPLPLPPISSLPPAGLRNNRRSAGALAARAASGDNYDYDLVRPAAAAAAAAAAIAAA